MIQRVDDKKYLGKIEKCQLERARVNTDLKNSKVHVRIWTTNPGMEGAFTELSG